MSKNLTGTPEVRDYLLGRGRLYFALLNTSDVAVSGWRDLGNVKDFSVSGTKELLKHFSTRAGTKTLDREITISQEVAAKFTLEEMSGQNIAAWLSGTLTAGGSNSAVAGFTEYQMITVATHGGVALGQWYEIVNASGVRAYDIDKTKLTVEKSAGTDVLLVEGTDYEVDELNGMIFFKSTAVNIAAAEPVDVTLTADAGARLVEKVTAIDQSSIRGALKFVSVNANDGAANTPATTGAETEWLFHKANLTADGDLGLLGDEIVAMPFTVSCEKNISNKTLTVTSMPRL